MAALTYDYINNIVSKHDTRYQWPDRTCLHPAFDLLKSVLGSEPNDSYKTLLNWTEEEAGAFIIDMFHASWLLWVIQYLEDNGYGKQSDIADLQPGDIIEFESDRLKPIGPNKTEIVNCIGIVANSDVFFMRALTGVYWVPLNRVNIKLAARITLKAAD